MPNKLFVERLNNELDNLGLPESVEERAIAFAKMLKIPRFKAQQILDGILLNADTVNQLAIELEVSPEWLTGRINDDKD